MLAAFVARLFFYTGHIFSDDAYYSYLSYTLYQGNYDNNYLGYPIFPLRVGFIGITAISMHLFGINEFSTLFFPLLFSLLNIILVYKLTELVAANTTTAWVACILVAFFPTDIIFASIGFPDLLNVFFINLGIYFLLKSFKNKKIMMGYAGGMFFFISMQFKETIYYFLILLFILFVYAFLINKKINPQLLIGIIFILGNYLIEGFVYLFIHNDFVYRITVTTLNYQFSFYDFFPYTARKLSGSKNYFRNLYDQIILINIKSVFLRRFYLLLPIVSVIQTLFSIKKNEHKLLLYWFWGLTILSIAFTTSLTEFKPLDLTRSWYIYPMLMPAIILSAIFVTQFSKFIKIALIVIYISGSIFMCFQYEIFLDCNNLESLKSFLRNNQSKMIFTDHFTKYSVDLIRGYEVNNSNRISGNEFDFTQIKKGDLVLLNQKHIAELKMQKFQFPDFSILKTQYFRETDSFNDFIFYEKVQ